MQPDMQPDMQRVAALGAGLIGRSWTALFLAAGRSVSVYDPDRDAEARVRREVERAWPVLTELGLTHDPEPVGELSFSHDPRHAVDGAQFIQESVPEQVGLKHALYCEIEPRSSEPPSSPRRPRV